MYEYICEPINTHTYIGTHLPAVFEKDIIFLLSNGQAQEIQKVYLGLTAYTGRPCVL